jgi:RNA polymerase sigma-54 factor
MTPALQQAIRMLQLSTLDLHTEIQQALESNLMLEVEDGETPAPEQQQDSADDKRGRDEDIPENLPVDADWDDIYQSAPPKGERSSADEDALHDYRQANMHEAPDLREHLSWQAGLQPFSPDQARAAAYIVDAIDEHGYLREWDELAQRLLEETALDRDGLEDVLACIQEFDPPGVAARDLRECLTLQLGQLDDDTPGLDDAERLVAEDQLALLANGDRAALLRWLGSDDGERLDAMIAAIQQLQPHPGESFSDHESQYVVPEVFVARQQGRWTVSLNPDIAPRIRINPEYLALVKRADRSEDQSTLREHLQEARFFLNSLKSRNETLLQVAQCIVEEQRAFLEYGEEAMKPLVLRDISDQLGVHESTVSRATANKFMQTPRGLFELKYFFSSRVSTTDGGTCSATAIQAMIKRMVAAEPPAKPLSDSKLASMLLDEGIKVARRTIAKYREGLGIAPSHERRERA